MDWQSLMERSTPNMAYQAWRHEPETGPTVYRSRTIFEDVTPELVRDFFWDDNFRTKWDPMLAYCKVLEECPSTGTMIVHWIKKEFEIERELDGFVFNIDNRMGGKIEKEVVLLKRPNREEQYKSPRRYCHHNLL